MESEIEGSIPIIERRDSAALWGQARPRVRYYTHQVRYFRALGWILLGLCAEAETTPRARCYSNCPRGRGDKAMLYGGSWFNMCPMCKA